MRAVTAVRDRTPSYSSRPVDAARTHPRAVVTDLEDLGRLVLATATGTMRTRRAARRLVGGPGGALQQVIVALMHMEKLEDHACSDNASIQVLYGRVVLSAQDRRTLLERGDWLSVPPTRHAIHAVGDAVVLITMVPPAHADGHRTAFVE